MFGNLDDFDFGARPTQSFADELARVVMEQFKLIDPSTQPQSIDDNTISIAVNGRRVTVSLDNLRQRCLTKPAICSQEAIGFVSGSIAVFRQSPSDNKMELAKVYPVLKSTAYVEFMRKELASSANPEPLFKPFTDDTAILYVVDTPNAFRFVTKGDLANAGLSADKVAAAVELNLGSLPPPRFERLNGPTEMYLLSTDDGLGTARLFDRKLWDRIETELGSAVAISVPTRDWVLVVRRSDEPAADKLRMMARRIVENEPYNISPTLLFRSTDGWVPLID